MPKLHSDNQIGLSIRIPEWISDWINEKAEVDGVSRSDVVRSLLIRTAHRQQLLVPLEVRYGSQKVGAKGLPVRTPPKIEDDDDD